MILDTLITDRTAADVSRVKALNAKGFANMTAAEKAEYLQPMKGAYNATDLNRVGEAVEYVANRLHQYGYAVDVQKIPHQRQSGERDEHTLLLLHGDDLTDSSAYGKTITNNGVTVSAAQSKFGGKSLYFNGASRLLFYLEQLGQEFTIDWWEYCESGAAARFCSEYAGGNNMGGLLLGYQGQSVYASSNQSGWDMINGTTMFSVTSASWVHWATVRKNGTLKTYRNGTLYAQANMSGNLLHTSYPAAIGDYRENDHSYFKGYIDEFRISDVARWESNFTPPTEPYIIEEPPIIDYSWIMSDIPTPEEMEIYIANIQHLRDVFTLVAPSAPSDAEGMTYQEANAIEQILILLDDAITRMIYAFRHSGTFYSNMGGLFL